jgi:hypothetical protein
MESSKGDAVSYAFFEMVGSVPISSFVSKYKQKRALMLGFAGCNATLQKTLHKTDGKDRQSTL